MNARRIASRHRSALVGALLFFMTAGAAVAPTAARAQDKASPRRNEDTHVVLFVRGLDRTAQRQALKAFPEVSWLRPGLFEHMAEVRIRGDAPAVASRMWRHESIDLVLNLRGEVICH